MARTLAIQAAGRMIDCFLSVPEEGAGPGPYPLVIVVHEIFGPDAHIQDVCRRITGLGYVTAAPNLFAGELGRLLTPTNIGLAMQAFAQAPPDLRRDPTKFAAFAASQPPERRPILEAFGRISSPAALESFTQDLIAVEAHLRALPEVDPKRVGVVGFCFGGTMAARLATVDPELRAAVVFYGQNPPLDAVPRIRAKVLGLYGSEDVGLTPTVPQLADAMSAAGKSFESKVYPGAEHAFFNDTRPTYHRMSAEDAWDRVVKFFGATLNA
jgi:carboxymethylenebutenolidase